MKFVYQKLNAAIKFSHKEMVRSFSLMRWCCNLCNAVKLTGPKCGSAVIMNGNQDWNKLYQWNSLSI